MSFSVYTVNGFGFDVANVDIDTFRDFIENHRAAFQKFDKKGIVGKILNRETSTITDVEDVVDNVIGTMSISPIIASIMETELGIRFDGCPLSDEDIEAVILAPMYPWQINDAERTLTAESLNEIMSKYANELGIYDVEYISATYSG